MRDKDQILLEKAYQSIYEKRKIHDELIRLDEMAGWSTGIYRSVEDQVVLDELMKRDDWKHILAYGYRDIANLTPNQKRVIRNYKTYLWNIDPLNKERIQKTRNKYRQSEKGIESMKKVYGAGATQTEEEKAAAKEKSSIRRKMYTKRPIVRARLKKYQDEYKINNPEKIKKYQDEYHKNPIVKARKKLYASQPEVRAKKNQSERDRRSRNRDEINRKKRELRLLKKQKESNN